MGNEEEFHVLVIGAGVAGLSIAHGLKKAGIKCTVYDRETTPRDRNWAVTLSWAHPLLAELLPREMFCNLRAVQPDPSLDNVAANKETVCIRDGATGEIIVEAHFPGVRRLNIQKTKRIWKDGVDVHYGKKLASICTSSICGNVVAQFEDGSHAEGTLLIGCDGGNSTVRRWLLGERAESEALPYTFMNFSFTLPAEKAVWLESVLNPNVDVATHPKSMYMGVFLLDKPSLQEPETWLFYLLVTWPIEDDDILGKDKDSLEQGSKRRLAKLRSHMEGWSDPFASVVSWLPDTVIIPPDQLRIWHPVPWNNYNGRVTLAGDAAHSMTFHRGQGGNLAIKDAMEFVEVVKRVKGREMRASEGIGIYDAGVVERGREVEISKAQAVAFHDYKNFRDSPVFKMGIKPSGQ